MAKEFTYRGRKEGELRALNVKDFARLLPSRERRSLLRGFSVEEQKVVDAVAAGKQNIETHCRDLLILPSFIGTTIKVHSGKEFFPLLITSEMMGHRLGEFALTRKNVKHSAPGVGATKSSSALSVK